MCACFHTPDQYLLMLIPVVSSDECKGHEADHNYLKFSSSVLKCLGNYFSCVSDLTSQTLRSAVPPGEI